MFECVLEYLSGAAPFILKYAHNTAHKNIQQNEKKCFMIVD